MADVGRRTRAPSRAHRRRPSAGRSRRGPGRRTDHRGPGARGPATCFDVRLRRQQGSPLRAPRLAAARPRVIRIRPARRDRRGAGPQRPRQPWAGPEPSAHGAAHPTAVSSAVASGGPTTAVGKVSAERALRSRRLRTGATGSPASPRGASGRCRCSAAGRPGAGSRRTSSASARQARPEPPSSAARNGVSAVQRLVGERLPAPSPTARVRSLSSAWKLTPWSTPKPRPPAIGSTWPPLRSALLTTASNTAIRRSAAVSACTRSHRVAAVDAVEDTPSPSVARPATHEVRPPLVGGLRHSCTIPRRAARPATPSAARRPSRAPRTRGTPRLALGQRAVGEVPQRALPRDRLVDDRGAADLADERGVRRGHHPTVEHQLAVDERRRSAP